MKIYNNQSLENSLNIKSVSKFFIEINNQDDFNDLYDYFSHEAWEVYSDTVPTLKKLKDDGFNIVITSNFDSRIYGVCEKFEIDKYVDYFTISSESGFSKPDEELFYMSLKKVNANTTESIHVGDNYNLDYLQ